MGEGVPRQLAEPVLKTIDAAMVFRRPAPALRGDWIVTWLGTCRLWSCPPSSPVGSVLIPGAPRELGVFLGPVHRCDFTAERIAVQVPHPSVCGPLVWINIWSLRNKTGRPTGVAFASLVKRKHLNSWLAAGWENRYLDGLIPTEYAVPQ